MNLNSLNQPLENKPRKMKFWAPLLINRKVLSTMIPSASVYDAAVQDRQDKERVLYEREQQMKAIKEHANHQAVELEQQAQKLTRQAWYLRIRASIECDLLQGVKQSYKMVFALPDDLLGELKEKGYVVTITDHNIGLEPPNMQFVVTRK